MNGHVDMYFDGAPVARTGSPAPAYGDCAFKEMNSIACPSDNTATDFDGELNGVLADFELTGDIYLGSRSDEHPARPDDGQR